MYKIKSFQNQDNVYDEFSKELPEVTLTFGNQIMRIPQTAELNLFNMCSVYDGLSLKDCIRKSYEDSLAGKCSFDEIDKIIEDYIESSGSYNAYYYAVKNSPMCSFDTMYLMGSSFNRIDALSVDREIGEEEREVNSLDL